MLSLVETIGSDKPHQFWRKLDFIELTNKNGDILHYNIVQTYLFGKYYGHILRPLVVCTRKRTV